jgi:HAD superfamily hydrolase (TIGR01549 family)
VPAAILDIDGTLVDTNYHHALAWWRAFRQSDLTVPLWRVHRSIGMGGEKLVPALIGEERDEEVGETVRAAEKVLYGELMREVAALSGARALIEELRGRGSTVVLASSAKEFEVEYYVDLLGARELAEAWTSSADVEATKPEPDLVRAALERAEQDDAVMVGDSTYDCESASRAGVEAIGVLTGGFSREELREAGATAVFASLEELIEGLDETPLAGHSSAS